MFLSTGSTACTPGLVAFRVVAADCNAVLVPAPRQAAQRRRRRARRRPAPTRPLASVVQALAQAGGRRRVVVR